MRCKGFPSVHWPAIQNGPGFTQVGHCVDEPLRELSNSMAQLWVEYCDMTGQPVGEGLARVVVIVDIVRVVDGEAPIRKERLF